MHPLLKHPLVDCDVEEAALWYAQRDPEAARRFVDESRNAMKAAAQDPLLYSIRFGDVRRARMHGFPHSVFFRLRDDAVVILAVLHGARQTQGVIVGRIGGWPTA